MSVVDAKSEIGRLVDWIGCRVEESGSFGVVVGMSGGVDSSFTAALSKRACPDSTLGVLMPCGGSTADERDARAVAKKFSIDTVGVNIHSAWAQMVGALEECVPAAKSDGAVKLARSNLKPRLRMACLYFVANRLGYLVAGTGNRSELAVGYFTKYGDGGVDILPLGNLVKSEVRELALEIGIPARIVKKVPSAGLWRGQTDESELGFTYEELDRYLLTGRGAEPVRKLIREREEQAGHKLDCPAVPPF